MKKIWVFNGVHGSGKSTIAEEITHRNTRFEYFDEVGKKIRKQRGGATTDTDESFDKEVMNEELKRDQRILLSPKVPIIETWHIGNIAYMEKRNPHLVDGYSEVVRKQLESFSLTAILFEIDHQTFKERMTDNVPSSKLGEYIAFFDSIFKRTAELYKQFGIDYVILENSKKSIDETTKEVLSHLS